MVSREPSSSAASMVAAPAVRRRWLSLAADETEQRGLDLGLGEIGATGDESDDGAGHFLGDETGAGFTTASSACAPERRVRRRRFCMSAGIVA